MPSQEADVLAAAQTKLTEVLVAITDQDVRWNAVASLGLVTLTRDWGDGTVDTVVVFGPDKAVARRDDEQGRNLWRLTGTADEVVLALRDLPAPSDPDAPDVPGDDDPPPSGMWT